MGIWDFSPISDANATADPAINFQEGQAANTVNNSARTLMQRLRFWADDTGGTIITGGTGNAYSATTASGLPTLRAGLTIRVRADRTNTGAVTLNADGKGAIPWRAQTGQDVPAGGITPGAFYTATYYAGLNEWRTDFGIPYGTGGLMDSRVALEAATTPSTITHIRTAGDRGLTDRGGTTFIKSATQPTGPLRTQSTGGQWWERKTYADSGFVVGREYLSAFHKSLIAGTATKAVFSGDSTTQGPVDGGGNPIWVNRIDALVSEMARDCGFANVTTYNRGHSGETLSVNWLDLANPSGASRLHDDMNDATYGGLGQVQLYAIRWGINDQATGRTLDQYEAALRAGLAELRFYYPVTQLSILLCSPNSTSDQATSEAYYESLHAIHLKAARDYQCCFLDIYAWMRDNRSTGDWADTITGGGHIHPGDFGATSIFTLYADALFPSGFRKFARNRFHNLTATQTGGSPLASAGSSTYPLGHSILRATVANGWPVEGSVHTVRHVDTPAIQHCYGYAGPDPGVWMRTNRADGPNSSQFTDWTSWVLVTSRIGFRAYKTADQTGIASAVTTKITFPTEAYDLGSRYDASISRWTPPAGIVRLSASVYLSGLVDQNFYSVEIQKNGICISGTPQNASGTIGGGSASVTDYASGTDYYEVFVYAAGAGTKTALGDQRYVVFSGHLVN